jgi:1-acyl-sn-glycerol-3-phosphate acyltransferase
MFYWFTKYTLGVALKLVFRPWSRGRQNAPRRGPVFLASNHLSFADHFFGPLPLRRKVTFYAKSEYFTGRGLKGFVSRAFFSGVGQIPLDRAGGEASERALRRGLQVLAAGKVLGIYPEGTRSPDGRLYKGRTGVARIALEARVPVVPCAMIGTFEFLPRGSFHPNWRIRPGVVFGAPLDFSRYYGKETNRAVLREVTDEIMREIGRLSGQEYVHMYAKQAKEVQAPDEQQDLPALVFDRRASSVERFLITRVVTRVRVDHAGDRQPGLIQASHATLDLSRDAGLAAVEDHARQRAAMRDLDAATAAALTCVKQELKLCFGQEPLTDERAGCRDPTEPGNIPGVHRRAQLSPQDTERLNVIRRIHRRGK